MKQHRYVISLSLLTEYVLWTCEEQKKSRNIIDHRIQRTYNTLLTFTGNIMFHMIKERYFFADQLQKEVPRFTANLVRKTDTITQIYFSL